MASKPRTTTAQNETEEVQNQEPASEVASPIRQVPELRHAATGAEPVVDGNGEPVADTVTMLFPGPVGVNHGGILHRFKVGLQEVPRFLAEGYGKKGDEPHWYLKASGVQKR